MNMKNPINPMNMKMKTQKKTGRTPAPCSELAVVLVFLAFLFSGAVLYLLLPKQSFSETEKRYLASLPEATPEAILSGETAAGIEEYLSDHLPARNFFVGLNSYFQLATGRNGSGGVYLGKDCWLIEKPFDRENRFEVNVGRIVDFARSAGIPAALTAVPEKGYIYGDRLPSSALKYEDAEYFSALSDHCGEDVTFVDLSAPMLQAAMTGALLFYRTDHHWTSAGAYLGYTELCRALGADAAPESDFDVETVGDFYGSSYSSSLYTLTPPDSLELWRSRVTGGKAEVIVEEGGETTERDGLFFEEALDGFDKYTVFLGGNHPLVTVRTGKEGGRLLVIKDSFAHCLVPFLAENYSEIVLVDLRYYKKPVSELIGAGGFDQLLFVYGIENLAESRDIIFR